MSDEPVEVVVRPATEDDLSWAAPLYVETFSPYLHGTEASLGAHLEARIAPCGWVAERGGEPVGLGLVESGGVAMATLRGLVGIADQSMPFHSLGGTMSVRWARYLPGAWFCTALVVAPAHRRTGVGRALVDRRVHAAREAGARAVFVTCVLGSGSEALYADAGFHPLADLQHFYRGGHRARLMLLPLREPDRTLDLPPRPPAGKTLGFRQLVRPLLVVLAGALVSLVFVVAAILLSLPLSATFREWVLSGALE